MASITLKGSFDKIDRFFDRVLNRKIITILERYAKQGVDALVAATPVETGETALSWGYEIFENNGNFQIYWTNSNIVSGYSVALLLQYGHGTGTGGYVEGIDYINPALKPIFQKIADAAWEEVTRL